MVRQVVVVFYWGERGGFSVQAEVVDWDWYGEEGLERWRWLITDEGWL